MEPGLPSAAEVKDHFQELSRLIREEWPEVDATALAETGGDLERVIELVAKQTEHTRTLVRRQLAELWSVTGHGGPGVRARVEEVVSELEARAREAMKQVKSDMLPKAETKLRENLWLSLLSAVGLGFLIGFFTRGLSRGR